MKQSRQVAARLISSDPRCAALEEEIGEPEMKRLREEIGYEAPWPEIKLLWLIFCKAPARMQIYDGPEIFSLCSAKAVATRVGYRAMDQWK